MFDYNGLPLIAPGDSFEEIHHEEMQIMHELDTRESFNFHSWLNNL